MDESAKRAIRSDFLEWSGGSTPEDDREIFVYVEYARSVEFDENQTRECLRDWMDEVEAGPWDDDGANPCRIR